MDTVRAGHARRIYPLDPRALSEEEMAVVFAMTSRRPEPFDEIQAMVTAEKAADFHERWVLGYGHASVAEHAVLHMAVENISRLAADALEDNRLGSYTEKSSRYQVLAEGSYHIPGELEERPDAMLAYRDACDRLFVIYGRMLQGVQEHLAEARPRLPDERGAAFRLRMRREATDTCRFVLPASTLTNIGVTMNARTAEHAVVKLLSSDLQEEREIGAELKERALGVTPTLIRHAERNDYLVSSRHGLSLEAGTLLARPSQEASLSVSPTNTGSVSARLVEYDPRAQDRLVAALLYRNAAEPYDDVERRARELSPPEQEGVVRAALSGLGDHDAPVRELEQVSYTFELVLDYGAYREFKRHRMQSYLPQPLTVAEGYVTPPLVAEAGLMAEYDEAMEVSAAAHRRLAQSSLPRVAEYAVTHAHLRRVISRMNLRECYAVFKLRTQPDAHFTIREAMRQALDQAREVHPLLFQYIRLRA